MVENKGGGKVRISPDSFSAGKFRSENFKPDGRKQVGNARGGGGFRYPLICYNRHERLKIGSWVAKMKKRWEILGFPSTNVWLASYMDEMHHQFHFNFWICPPQAPKFLKIRWEIQYALMGNALGDFTEDPHSEKSTWISRWKTSTFRRLKVLVFDFRPKGTESTL